MHSFTHGLVHSFTYPLPMPHKFDYPLLLALLIPSFAMLPFIQHNGMPNVADGLIHLLRQVDFDRALRDGALLPGIVGYAPTPGGRDDAHHRTAQRSAGWAL